MEEVPAGTEDSCASAPEGPAGTVEGAPWTESFAGRTVEGGRRAPGFSVWTEQGAPGSLDFLARALFWERAIPSREGCAPAGYGGVPPERPPG
jgi:hypothetical protein